MILKYYSASQKLMHNLLVLFAIMAFMSCKKLVEVKSPNNRLLKESVFNADLTAISVLNQVLSFANYSSYYGVGGLTVHTGLSGDELNVIKTGSPYSQDMIRYFENNLNSSTISSSSYPDLWYDAYTNIFIINDAIEGITASSGLSQHVKQELTGEAKFMRAFFYFYLVNIYGDVPLVLTTDYVTNALLPRTDKSEVYRSIVSDLKDAYNLLGEQYLDGNLSVGSNDRVRPTKWAASALLARVHLYMGEWQLAEQVSTEVINQTNLFGLDSLNGVFLKNNHESILQLQSTNLNSNTWFGYFFIIPDSSGANANQPTYLSDHLLNSFEPGDQRKEKWINYSTTKQGVKYAYPYKYKAFKYINANEGLTENYVILRLAEQYLIRAEARARQNNFEDALADLKTIRERAGLLPLEISGKDAILDAILHERQVELFLEWGDRWLELKRTGKINLIMQAISEEKGGHWDSYKQFYPISTNELTKNPNLDQTEGY